MTPPAIWVLYKRLTVLQAEHGDSGEYDKGSVVHWQLPIKSQLDKMASEVVFRPSKGYSRTAT